MLGLPKSTELSKQLPKKAIYAKFNMNTAAKERFDADISRISIIAEISPATTNIAAGESVSAIFALLVLLKRQDYDERTIAQLSKLIDQNLVLVLECDGKRKLAVFRTKLLQGEWQPSEDCKITLAGLDLDAVWENIIKDIGEIEITGEHTLDEQIAVDERKIKLTKEIARVEKLARKERQPKKKFELASQVKMLQKQLQELSN